MRGAADANIRFDDLRGLLISLNFSEHVKGSHHIFARRGVVYWSDEDQSFIAEVPELAGRAADGPTRQEALADAEIVINEWIETAKELGREIPEPKGRLLFA